MGSRYIGLFAISLVLGCAFISTLSDDVVAISTQLHERLDTEEYNPSDGEDQMPDQDATANAMEQLKERLYSTDQTVSGLAVAELIRMGRQATPIFLEALKHPNARTRRLAAEGLAELADPASADALFEATHDPNEEVRARAAGALYRLGDKRALEVLVATINDYPDLLHSPYTDSMYALMQGEEEVLPLIVPLLRSSDTLTRTRAFIVLEAIVTHLPQTKDWDELWRSLGSYDPEGPQAERDNAVQHWQDWVAALKK